MSTDHGSSCGERWCDACRGVDRGLFFETRRVRLDNCQHSFTPASVRAQQGAGDPYALRVATGGCLELV